MLTFRTKMRLSDIEAVRRISSSTKLFDHNDVEITASLAEEALELQQNPQWRDAAHDIRFIFAEQDGAICAYVCYGRIPDSDTAYELYWLATDKQFQGQGIGHLLLQQVIQLIRQAGGSKIYIKTEGRSGYHATHVFYNRCGFELEARLKQYYGKNDDCCIYSKSV